MTMSGGKMRSGRALTARTLERRTVAVTEGLSGLSGVRVETAPAPCREDALELAEDAPGTATLASLPRHERSTLT
jgi:hypothetical protein